MSPISRRPNRTREDYQKRISQIDKTIQKLSSNTLSVSIKYQILDLQVEREMIESLLERNLEPLYSPHYSRL